MTNGSCGLLAIDQTAQAGFMVGCCQLTAEFRCDAFFHIGVHIRLHPAPAQFRLGLVVSAKLIKCARMGGMTFSRQGFILVEISDNGFC